MTKNILAFGASNSKKSINKQFANYAANQIKDASVKLIDLNDFEMPIYSIDRQNNLGIPDLALNFLDLIKNSDGIVISLAEHNGSYSVAFKNVFDWTTRIIKNIWFDKPILLLSTAPGQMGGSFVLETATKRFKRMTTNAVISFSLPSFDNNFSKKEGILNIDLKDELDRKIAEFESHL